MVPSQTASSSIICLTSRETPLSLCGDGCLYATAPELQDGPLQACVEQRFDILSRESMHAPNFPVQALTFLLAFLAATTRADDASTKGQEIFEKNQRAVVTVEMVTKTSYSKDGQTSAPTDSKYELTGTVVDPSGLTVLALSGCEPAEFYRRVSARIRGLQGGKPNKQCENPSQRRQ